MTNIFEYLEGPEACNFRKENGETVWTCHHDLRFTKKWAKDNKKDFKLLRAACEAKGGYCDCEVLFNVEWNV